MFRSFITAAAPAIRVYAPLFVSALALAACAHEADTTPSAPQAPGATAAPAPVTVSPAPAVSAAPATTAAAAAPAAEAPVIVKEAFLQPESALYDAEQDVYFVSSINGKPGDADGNGFITKVSPDGKILDAKFVDGTKKGSTLNAPKGLAVSGDTLYAADLTFVRLFDRKTGAPKGKTAIPGATFLNDLCSAPDGSVYVSDTGIKPKADSFDPTGSDSVYKITKGGKVEKVIANKDLGGPNGLTADDTGVWVVTMRSGELFHVGKAGKQEGLVKLPSGFLDGLVKLPDGNLLVTTWATSSVLKGTPSGPFTPFLSDVKSPADIGYDSKRNVLLIPQMQLDSLQLVKLPAADAIPAAAPTPTAAAPATPVAAASAAPAAKLPSSGSLPAAAAPAAAPSVAPAPTPAAKVPAAAGAPAGTPAVAPSK
jgi:sugar lactone lactonase YvrE